MLSLESSSSKIYKSFHYLQHIIGLDKRALFAGSWQCDYLLLNIYRFFFAQRVLGKEREVDLFPSKFP